MVPWFDQILFEMCRQEKFYLATVEFFVCFKEICAVAELQSLLCFTSNAVCSKKKEDSNDFNETVLEDDNPTLQQEAAESNAEAQSQRYISGLFVLV